MAIELHIFLSDSRVPDCRAWQRAIEQLGFSTVLDPTLDVRKDTGFRPTSYTGQSTGFEFYLEASAAILSSYSHIAPQVGHRDKCATFRWGGDLTEMCAALSSAAALAKISDGIYFYPDDDLLYTADEAVEATRRYLSSV
jgi:hypothetical protein